MQTQAEKKLINRLSALIKRAHSNGNTSPRLLNIGAGDSLVVESALARQAKTCVIDRIDIEDCRASHRLTGKAYTSSVESMPMLKTGTYTIAYANFVFEHVVNLKKTADEIHRILRPGGHVVVTIPNPSAPEFLLGRYIPLQFRRILRKKQAWATYYSYKNIMDFCSLFTGIGFICRATDCYPALFSYLNRYRLLGPLSQLYDQSLISLNARPLMGHACIQMQKKYE